MEFRGLLLALAAASLAAGAARAEESHVDRVELDSARSEAEFSVKVMWLIGVGGHFGKVSGTVAVDRFRSQAVVDARIDANAVSMSNDSYEEWVKSAEFFDVANHPDIHFVSDSFPLQRLLRGGELTGVLTIRGVEQKTRFELEPAECDHPAYDCPISVHGAIHRSEFGMRSRRGTLSDKVDLRFKVFAVPSASRLNQ